MFESRGAGAHGSPGIPPTPTECLSAGAPLRPDSLSRNTWVTFSASPLREERGRRDRERSSARARRGRPAGSTVCAAPPVFQGDGIASSEVLFSVTRTQKK